MYKKIIMFLSATSLLILSSCSSLQGNSSEINSRAPSSNSKFILPKISKRIFPEAMEKVVSQIEASKEQAELTIINYQHSDGNLDLELSRNIVQMAKVGPANGTAVITVYHSKAKSWRGVITRGLLTKENIYPFTADLQNLRADIEWAATVRPAKKYMLIMSGNGFDMLNNLGTDTETSIHGMLITYFRNVFADLKTKGIKFDVIGFDAGLEGMIEVAYELADYTNVIIASEGTEPGNGWPYDIIFANMINLDGKAIGTLVVNKSIEDYSGKSDITMSAVDTKKLKSFVDNVFTKFVEKNMNGGITKAEYLNAVKHAQKYSSEYIDTYVDMNSFLGTIRTDDTSKVIGWVSSTLIATKSTGSSVSGSTGLSIYAPSKSFKNDYGYTLFSKQTGWNKFIENILRPIHE